jgi:hypothetical protein
MIATSRAFRRGQRALFDLVGDVRDDLHRPAQVLAAALLVDDRLVDLAGREVVTPRRRDRHEALVVAQVQVGLGAVVGDEDLAVLKRVHRARIDVDVGVHLDDGDVEPARLQERAQRRRGQALAERRRHAARDEDVLRVLVGHRPTIRAPGRSTPFEPSRHLAEGQPARSLRDAVDPEVRRP